MKKLLSILAMCFTVSLASTSNANEFDDAKNSYLAAGQAIIDMVNSNSVDVAVVEKNVLIAVQAGVKLANAYSKKHPDGKATLDEVIANAMSGGAVGPMGSLSFDAIEADWHDVAHFEKNNKGVDLQDEDNEHFLDPIHTIVHPVMVLVAAKDHAKDGNADSLNAMKAEMQEGMEQVESTTEVINN